MKINKYIYICVYIYIYIYLFMHTHTHIHTIAYHSYYCYHHYRSMQTYPSGLNAYTSKSRPVVGFVWAKHIRWGFQPYSANLSAFAARRAASDGASTHLDVCFAHAAARAFVLAGAWLGCALPAHVCVHAYVMFNFLFVVFGVFVCFDRLVYVLCFVCARVEVGSHPKSRRADERQRRPGPGRRTRCRAGQACPHGARGAPGGYSTLRVDIWNVCSFNMASKDVRILCGAQSYRGLQHFAMRTSNASKNNSTASRNTEVFLASAMYS